MFGRVRKRDGGRISPPINIIIPDRWQNNREQTGAPGARADD